MQPNRLGIINVAEGGALPVSSPWPGHRRITCYRPVYHIGQRASGRSVPPAVDAARLVLAQCDERGHGRSVDSDDVGHLSRLTNQSVIIA